MEYRNYEFVLVGGSNIDIYRQNAYSLQEAISHAYIKLTDLRNKDGKDWKIVKATDTTHFKDVKAL